MSFKVEIRTTCKVCGGDITGKRYRSYCSKKCRDHFYQQKYQPMRSEWQRNRDDGRHSKPDSRKIKCLVCGRWYVQVCTHVLQRHGMLAREYKKFYGMDVKRGKVPEWYREMKGSQAKENGTENNIIEIGKKFWFKPDDPKAGRYERSEETMERLKNLHKLTKAYVKCQRPQ